MAGIYRTQDATTERVYLHGDHLGSSSVVTNASGTVAESYSFDPWAAPRNAATWVSDLSEWPSYQGDRGFTGHEMLASLELVHMNARIYDPALGRFLSADPIIQFEGDLQNYNRYSYVLNNPLKYTDPSGLFIGKLLGAIVGLLQALFTAIKPYIQAIIGFAEAKPLLFGAILGGTLGGIQGGFRGAVRGAFFGALSAGIAKGVGDVFDELAEGGFTELARSLAHGVTQGALSVAQGGDFAAGFYSAAFASSAGSVMGKTDWGKATFRYRHNRVIAAAIVGGTASELAGGKFANGTVTAAMVQLFNAENGVGDVQEEEGFGETIELVQEAIDTGVNLEAGELFGSIDDFDPDVQRQLDARNIVTFHGIKRSNGLTTGRIENTGPVAWVPVIVEGKQRYLQLDKTISGTFRVSNKELVLGNLRGITGHLKKGGWVSVRVKLLGFPRVGKIYNE